MKIGLIHNNLEYLGGAERFVVTLIGGLTSRGHEVKLATFDKIDWDKVIYHFGFVDFPTEEACLFPLKLPVFGLYQKFLPSLIVTKLKDCDRIVDTHGGCYFNLGGLTKPINVTYVHGGATFLPDLDKTDMSKYDSGLWKLYSTPHRWISKRSSRSLGKALTNSRFSAIYLKRRLNIDADVIYPPISQANRYLASRPGRGNEVLTISRFAPEKGLEQVAEIAKRLPSVKFYVAGITEARSQAVIASLKQPNVQLFLNPPWQTIRSLQQTSKVYLHTTSIENFGMAIAESMTAGCIPVAYDGGGVPEFVAEKYLFTTVEEAVELIKKYLRSWHVKKSIAISKSVAWLGVERFMKQIGPTIEGKT